MPKREKRWSFHFIANDLALDFADTVSWRGSEAPIERFPEFAAVVSWARQSSLIDERRMRQMIRLAEAKPDVACRAHRRALALRDLVYSVFASIADGDGAPAGEICRLNRLMRKSLGQLELKGREPPYQLEWRAHPDLLEPVLGPVIKAAADLLSSNAIGKLRKCGSPRCGWLFLDRSRTGKRRWCAMWACGNRAKAQRFHRRHAGH